MRRLIAVVALIVGVLAPHAPSASAVAAGDGSRCTVSSGGTLFGGTQGIVINGKCQPVSSGGGGQGLEQKIVVCGIHAPGRAWNPQCGSKIMNCYQVKPGRGNVPVPAFATLTRANGKWGDPQVWCPDDPRGGVTMQAIRAQAFRALPRLPVASAWKHTALVNAELLLWIPTGTTRTLPTVTIVGQRVGLRIDLTTVHWNFGDGSTATTDNPGKPYDEQGDPCRTAQCPDYYGHTYRHTGSKTITATTSWHAQYRIGGGAWTDLPGGDLTAPRREHTIRVVQARGVLTQNPGGP